MATQLLLLDPREVQSAPKFDAARPAATVPSGTSTSPLRRRGSGPSRGRRAGPLSTPGPSSLGPSSPHAGRVSQTSVVTSSGPARDAVYRRLDDRTREIGLRGVEDARRALAAAVGRSGIVG